MEDLNDLELIILTRLSIKYPIIKQHIPFLKVVSREITGVGMYVNFGYINQTDIPNLGIYNGTISTNERVEIEGLRDGLAFEVDISNGRINFIEFVTYGEEWDGKLGANYKFK